MFTTTGFGIPHYPLNISDPNIPQALTFLPNGTTNKNPPFPSVAKATKSDIRKHEATKKYEIDIFDFRYENQSG